MFRVYVSSTTPASKPIDLWVTRTAACGSPGGTTCAYTSTVDLVDGRSYNLYVQSYGPGGFSTGGGTGGQARGAAQKPCRSGSFRLAAQGP